VASEPIWPGPTTLIVVNRQLAEVDAIGQRAANEGFGDLVDIAEDATEALKALKMQIENTIEAQEDPDGE
jgi:hypothetical protein